MSWRYLTTVRNEIETHLLKAYLEQAGIPVLSRTAGRGHFTTVISGAVIPEDILVPADRWQEAQQILRDLSPAP